MRPETTIFIAIIALVGILIAGLIALSYIGDRADKECQELGGVVMRSVNGYICVKLERLK